MASSVHNIKSGGDSPKICLYLNNHKVSNRIELELSELQISFFLLRHTFLFRREKDFSNITEQMSNISVDQTYAKVVLQGICDKDKTILQGIIKISVIAME